jgi:hypothetical protein
MKPEPYVDQALVLIDIALRNDNSASQSAKTLRSIRDLLDPPTIWEFGGVEFKETGEVRPAQMGEWYLTAENTIHHVAWTTTTLSVRIVEVYS